MATLLCRKARRCFAGGTRKGSRIAAWIVGNGGRMVQAAGASPMVVRRCRAGGVLVTPQRALKSPDPIMPPSRAVPTMWPQRALEHHPGHPAVLRALMGAVGAAMQPEQLLDRWGRLGGGCSV